MLFVIVREIILLKTIFLLMDVRKPNLINII